MESGVAWAGFLGGEISMKGLGKSEGELARAYGPCQWGLNGNTVWQAPERGGRAVHMHNVGTFA